MRRCSKRAARLSRRKPKPPTEQPRESARGCEPSRTPSPRGCRGAERPTLASSGTRVSARTAPQLHRRSKPSTEQTRKNMRRRSKRAARLFRQEPKFRLTSRESMCAAVPNALPVCFVGNQPFRSNSPRESARGCEPSRTPSPRGIGERSAPRPRRRKPKFPPEQPHGFVGGRNLRPNRRGRTCAAVPNAPPACFVGNQPFRPNSPGRAREGVNPLASRPRGGVGERSAPRSASSGTKIFIRILRESSRGSQPSRLPIEAGDLRGGKVACPKGKQVASRPTKRNRRFRLVAPGADFFGGEPAPRRKNRFLADSAPGNPQDFSGI